MWDKISNMNIQFSSFASQSGSAVSSQTFALTCPTQQPVAFIGVNDGNSTTNKITGVTYAGNAATVIATVASGNGLTIQLWVANNPTPGTNNVVVSRSVTTGQLNCCAVAYSVVAPVTQPDNFSSAQSNGVNLMPGAPNCWVLAFGSDNGTLTAGTGFTSRGTFGSEKSIFMDTNGSVNGLQSPAFTASGPTSPVIIAASISPIQNANGGILVGLI